jgi:hypothetical protein
MEAWRLKIGPWRVYWPVDADSHHFEEELDKDRAIRIRIRIKVMRFRNTDSCFEPASNIYKAHFVVAIPESLTTVPSVQTLH